MAKINVENMEDNAELFMGKMGFAHDTEGLDLTDDQLVNFLLICHQMEYGIGEEEEVEEDDGMKIKVIKMGDGEDMRSMMDQILGHDGPKLEY